MDIRTSGKEHQEKREKPNKGAAFIKEYNVYRNSGVKGKKNIADETFSYMHLLTLNDCIK